MQECKHKSICSHWIEDCDGPEEDFVGGRSDGCLDYNYLERLAAKNSEIESLKKYVHINREQREAYRIEIKLYRRALIAAAEWLEKQNLIMIARKVRDVLASTRTSDMN